MSAGSIGGAGRVVGGAQEQQFGRGVADRGEDRVGVEREVVGQPRGDDRRALDARELGVGGKGRLDDRDAVDARAAEGADEQVDRVVAAARDPQRRGRDAVEVGEALAERGGLRLGVAVDPRLARDERGEGVLVGVEADRPGQRRAGDVARRKREDFGAGEAGWRGSCPALRGARACASRPSRRASAAAGAAMRRARRLGETRWTVIAFMKVSVDTPPVKRAAPSVGRTWLDPAR